MRGVITTGDVVRHLGIIFSEFGLACTIRCVLAAVRRRETTFLDVAFKVSRP
ncbi:MAG: hypothetical protein HY901_09210 [Deltaproteobacteria bacterium]|nr:hypothetical protein [Deltaproteobacteria bacterium]